MCSMRASRSSGIALLLLAAFVVSAWSTCTYSSVDIGRARSGATGAAMPADAAIPPHHCPPASNAPATEDPCTLDLRAEQGVPPDAAAFVLEKLSPATGPVPFVLELWAPLAAPWVVECAALAALKLPRPPIYLLVSVFLL